MRACASMSRRRTGKDGGTTSGSPTSCSLSITEADYRKDRWISVEGGSFFKIRVLLAGRLLERDGSIMLESPQAQLHVCVGARGGGYMIAGQVPTTLVVLHCARSCSASASDCRSRKRPHPLRALAGSQILRRVSQPGQPDAASCSARPSGSMHPATACCRRCDAAYLEALAMEMVCQIVTDLARIGGAASRTRRCCRAIGGEYTRRATTCRSTMPRRRPFRSSHEWSG